MISAEPIQHAQHEPYHSVDRSEHQHKQLADLSPKELLALSHEYIEVSQKAIETASQPFIGKGYIPPVKLKEAIELLHTTQEQLRNLQELLMHLLSRLPEKAFNKIAAHYSDITGEIYITIEEANRLITSLENEEDLNRLDIMQKSSRLIADLNKLDLFFKDGEASA
jgi:hypothetical protein